MQARTPPTCLRPATLGDREYLEARLRVYQSEIAAFSDGVDVERTLEPTWFSDPRLHPFVIESEGSPRGFALVMGREYTAACGEDADHSVYDFWVEPEQRGSGLARRAARELFDRLAGSWSITVLSANLRARRFWEGVLADELSKAGEPGRDAAGYLVLQFSTVRGPDSPAAR